MAVEIPWALLGFEPDRRAGGVPQQGGNPATAPISWVFVDWERKIPLGQQVCLYTSLSFQNFAKPFNAKLTLKCPNSGLCGLWQFSQNLLPLPSLRGPEKPSMEVGAKADPEFHPKLDVFFFVCLAFFLWFCFVLFFF